MCSTKNVPVLTVIDLAIAELDLYWVWSVDGAKYAIDTLEGRLLRVVGQQVWAAPLWTHRGEWEPLVTPPCADWKEL